MKKITIIVALHCLIVVNSLAQEHEKLAEIRGKWKFSIGDNMEWSKPLFNDKDWELVMVPSTWEDQGFNGYDGFAWYRKNIHISSELTREQLYLHLGFIDDADEVYFNGHLIGFSGSMPPKYSTAFDAFRSYYIPSKIIRYDKYNVIAIRVYDAGLAGGIVNGDMGLYSKNRSFPMEIELQGIWKFKLGDNENYSNPLYNDNNWPNITVPRSWEDQGFRDIDGYGWYRKKFFINNTKTNEHYVIVLGKIDDVEEVYLNGEYIGPLKKISESNDTRVDEPRVYYISGKLFQNNKYNVLAVRVKDFGGRGGIYEGQIGILKQKDFVHYWRSRR